MDRASPKPQLNVAYRGILIGHNKPKLDGIPNGVSTKSLAKPDEPFDNVEGSKDTDKRSAKASHSPRYIDINELVNGVLRGERLQGDLQALRRSDGGLLIAILAYDEQAVQLKDGDVLATVVPADIARSPDYLNAAISDLYMRLSLGEVEDWKDD